jgi:hypothetical protein
MMAESIQLFQTGIDLLYGSTRLHKVFQFDLPESLEQVIEGFGVINEGREWSIA